MGIEQLRPSPETFQEFLEGTSVKKVSPGHEIEPTYWDWETSTFLPAGQRAEINTKMSCIIMGISCFDHPNEMEDIESARQYVEELTSVYPDQKNYIIEMIRETGSETLPSAWKIGILNGLKK